VISVVIVEDDPIVRAWVRLALEDSEFYVAGEAEDAGRARELLSGRRADLLLVDQRLPDMLGTDLVRELRLRRFTKPALLMTARAEPGLREKARAAGAQGAILKSQSAERLLELLRLVRAGREAYDPAFPSRPPGQPTLSPRESEVTRLIAAGKTNREIATALSVSPETIKTLIARTAMKLSVHRRTQIVAEARRLGLL
jgi:two-component system, NarL family, nitrate/nitrite response regulator NarL